MLKVGSSISPRFCDELIRVSVDVLRNLNSLGVGAAGLSSSLAYVVLKAAISASGFQVNENLSIDRKTSISNLMYFLPEEVVDSSEEIPLRGSSSVLDLSDRNTLSCTRCSFKANVELGQKYISWYMLIFVFRAMVMQFPAWFYFAASLIFCGKELQDSHLSKLIYDAVKSAAINDIELHQAAHQLPTDGTVYTR